MSSAANVSGVHQRVVEELGAAIVRGDIAPGTVLPSDELETRYDASRTAIREAQKVLMAKGLISARQRVGTSVRPPEDWSVLDSDVLRWRWSGPFDPKLLADLDGVRRIVEPSAAALAATSRTDADLDRIDGALDRISSTHRDDHTSLQHIEADVEFHSAILDASGNEILSSLKSILEPALRMRDRLVYDSVVDDPYDAHAQVADAIRAQDPEAARQAMSVLIDAASADVTAALQRATAPPP